MGATLCSASEEVKDNPSAAGRFADPWWRQFDQPTAGYRDSSGFVNRLPLRLESKELILWGLVDAGKMWREFEGEQFQPILLDGKAVVTVWFNNFTDTDCGGAYLETWYNTFVTKSSGPQLNLEMSEAGPAAVAAHPDAQSFLLRVLCGDAPGNPGAALKAITGGREMFGFPKHPVPAEISLEYKEPGLVFECSHLGQLAVKLSCVLPEAVEAAATIQVDLPESAPDAQIGGPVHGGTHKGHNGALQSFYKTSVKCSQTLAPWCAETDKLELGQAEHYRPLSRWDFVPVLKAQSSDFKICAHKPSGWISGKEAGEAVQGHESRLVSGEMAGAL